MSLFLLRQGQLLCERRVLHSVQLQPNLRTVGHAICDHRNSLSPMPDCPSLIVAEYQGPAHDPKLHVPVLNLIRKIGIVEA